MINIEKFCEKTGFEFHQGTVGFGRPCVGIMNKETECWVGYSKLDPDSYAVVDSNAMATKWKTAHAYHKGDYLAVLIDDAFDKDEATKELDFWLGKIMDAPFAVSDFTEVKSLTTIKFGKPVVQKYIKNGD